MRPIGSPAQLQERRTHAIQLLKQGYSPVEAARKIGVDRRSVRRWNASFRKLGSQGLKAKFASGRPLKLDDAKRKTLTNILIGGAIKAGYQTDLWTCPRVAHLIQKKFRIRYHSDHISRILHTMGFSSQKPERRARERDEKAIRHWVRYAWPQIKKKPVS
jgi:transposase